MADRAATAMTMKLREIFGSRVLGPVKPFREPCGSLVHTEHYAESGSRSLHE